MKKFKNKFHLNNNLLPLPIIRLVPFNQPQESPPQQEIHFKRVDMGTKLSDKVVPTQRLTYQTNFLWASFKIFGY